MLLSARDELKIAYDIKAVLVRNCLSHLPLPWWLRDGVAAQLWYAFEPVAGTFPDDVFDADLTPEHHRFWNETTIQSFWAGTCDTEYPDKSKLAYDLGKILVHLLGEKTQTLVDYLRCAHEYDAGQSAARACLKINLGDLAATFLGPGRWTPDPLAIAECWDRSWRSFLGED